MVIDGLTWKAGVISSEVIGKTQFASFSVNTFRAGAFCQTRQRAAAPTVSRAICLEFAIAGRPFYQV